MTDKMDNKMESETSTATDNKIEKEEKAEWEIKLQEMLKNAYLSGMSKGGKTFVGVIYETILKGKKAKLNPANILLSVEKKCKTMLSVGDAKTNNYNNTDTKKGETNE